MSMSDPIADMFTRIRNAQAVDQAQVKMPSSKLKVSIASVLKQEGYIDDYKVGEGEGKFNLEIDLTAKLVGYPNCYVKSLKFCMYMKLYSI